MYIYSVNCFNSSVYDNVHDTGYLFYTRLVSKFAFYIIRWFPFIQYTLIFNFPLIIILSKGIPILGHKVQVSKGQQLYFNLLKMDYNTILITILVIKIITLSNTSIRVQLCCIIISLYFIRQSGTFCGRIRTCIMILQHMRNGWVMSNVYISVYLVFSHSYCVWVHMGAYG